jgi:hypothetical protein
MTSPSFLDSRNRIAGCLQSLLCLQGAGSPVGVSGSGAPVGVSGAGTPVGVSGAGAEHCQQLAQDCLHPSPLPQGNTEL